MDTLTFDDVLSWDVSVIRQMFAAAQSVGSAEHTLGESLDTAGRRTNWHGEAGQAFQKEIGQIHRSLDRDGHESKGVAAALRQAEGNVAYCVKEANSERDWARSCGWRITPDWRVDVSGSSDRRHDPQLVQNSLDQLKVRAHKADHELALAMRAAAGEAQVDDQGHETGAPPPSSPATSAAKLTPEEQAEVARWSQINGPGGEGVDNGVGDCSRWATASALANKYGVRTGPDGKEINLPPDIQQNMMGGAPLHFPPTKTDINRIAHSQGVAPGTEKKGFPGGPELMTSQLNGVGLTSTAHMGAPPALMDQMTADLQAGHPAIVNGAFPKSDGHFISVTGMTTGADGVPMYLVNDSNRMSDGNPNGNTLPHLCTRSQLEAFLTERAQYGTPGYSTVE